MSDNRADTISAADRMDDERFELGEPVRVSAPWNDVIYSTNAMSLTLDA